MKARVIVTTAPPELMDGFVQLTNETLVPAARRQPGYRGYIAFYDPEIGVTTAVTLWDDELEQSSDDALRPAREEFAKAFDLDVRVEKYDVAVAEVR